MSFPLSNELIISLGCASCERTNVTLTLVSCNKLATTTRWLGPVSEKARLALRISSEGSVSSLKVVTSERGAQSLDKRGIVFGVGVSLRARFV